MKKKDNNTGQELFLESASGFIMPFITENNEEVQVSLGYGDQTHPYTGEKFFHRGVDLVCHHLPLFAMASGTVIGVGTDAIHQNYIVVKYGKYEVRYGHITESFVSYGTPVVAGQQIATSGDFLHLDVTFAGEPLDPLEFLGMIYCNMMQLASLGVKGQYRIADMNVDVKTDYDADQESVLQLMLRWLPEYMNAICQGSYRPSMKMEHSLRNIFAQSAQKNYFFDTIPDMSNPLGLSSRAAPLAGKVQNLLIGDFLNFLAMHHNIYLPSWSDAQKKNFLTKQGAMAFM